MINILIRGALLPTQGLEQPLRRAARNGDSAGSACTPGFIFPANHFATLSVSGPITRYRHVTWQEPPFVNAGQETPGSFFDSIRRLCPPMPAREERIILLEPL